ncbi:ureidoglycolate lyase [Pseudomonas cuatrocienegasensis]|uniref:Ureidoglycolate lyase n=1 Tax=Pseudomonas cuatrocienegasensis TaxID=543360 RepID=A0ABY1B6I6_9PSED|nr:MULTISPECIES: ureidoglycolate lyase [Pseudomonas]OEC36845.1 ureidoglycolate hydrolase [Pseudomonas sp. 21C1]SEQ08302.1 ureidoglycolate lyase [Pseudomonas cuatrocienegasensis]
MNSAAATLPALPLIVEALTAEAFAPFGDVLETANAQHFPINAGTTTRYHDLARVCASGEAPRVLFNLFDGQAWHAPINISMLERHPLGSQAFYPVDGASMLIVVAPPGELDEQAIRAFISRPDQGVNYAPGTWHHPLLSLQRPGRFAVVDRGGAGNNCDEQALLQPRVVRQIILPD